MLASLFGALLMMSMLMMSTASPIARCYGETIPESVASFSAPASGTIIARAPDLTRNLIGVVTDTATGKPVPGADVRASQGSRIVATTT